MLGEALAGEQSALQEQHEPRGEAGRSLTGPQLQQVRRQEAKGARPGGGGQARAVRAFHR